MIMSFVDKVTIADFWQTGPPQQYRSDRAHVVPKFERTYTDIETPDLSTKNFRGHHESIEPMRPSIKAASGTKNVITPRRSHIKQHQDGYISHHIPAYVNELSVSAFPDSCSSLNLISEDFVLRSNLLFDKAPRLHSHFPAIESFQPWDFSACLSDSRGNWRPSPPFPTFYVVASMTWYSPANL
jgi:hypothetical protein